MYQLLETIIEGLNGTTESKFYAATFLYNFASPFYITSKEKKNMKFNIFKNNLTFNICLNLRIFL